jgi:hypothetical protein
MIKKLIVFVTLVIKQARARRQHFCSHARSQAMRAHQVGDVVRHFKTWHAGTIMYISQNQQRIVIKFASGHEEWRWASVFEPHDSMGADALESIGTCSVCNRA